MAVKEASSDNILIRLAVAEDEQHIDLLHKVINDAYSSGTVQSPCSLLPVPRN